MAVVLAATLCASQTPAPPPTGPVVQGEAMEETRGTVGDKEGH